MSVLPTKGGAVSEQPGQPETSQTAEQASGNVQPQWLTREDAAALFAEQLEQVKREDQRQRDKMEARINKQHELLVAASAKLLGQAPTDAQKAELRNEAIAQVMALEEPAQPAKAQSKPAVNDDPILKDIEDVFKEVGAWVEESDPEAKELLKAMESGSPRKILAAAEAAAKAKLSRSLPANTQSATPQRTTILAGSATPAAGREGMARELQQLIEHPTPANLPRIRELRERLKTL